MRVCCRWSYFFPCKTHFKRRNNTKPNNNRQNIWSLIWRVSSFYVNVKLVLDIQVPAVMFSGRVQQQCLIINTYIYELFRLRIIEGHLHNNCVRLISGHPVRITFGKWCFDGGPRFLLDQRTALCLSVCSLLGHDDLFQLKKITKADLRY